MELAIDTTTEWASIALSQDGVVGWELSWRVGQNHSVELVPAILSLLRQARATPSSLTGIVVSQGPGSFNGIRVGMAVAKGLAFALSLPLVGVSSLEALAYPYREQGLPLCPVRPAGVDLAVALFRWRQGRKQVLWSEQLMSREALASRITLRTLFCGELSPALKAQLKEALGRKAAFPPPLGPPRAGYLLEMAWPRLRQGEGDELASLQPLYLRHPHITLSQQGVGHG